VIGDVGVTMMLASGPGLTITAVLPEMLPEAATTVPLPDDVAVNSPPVVMLPIPPVTDQMGVKETALLLASLPAALNCCVEPAANVVEVGVTAMLASAPGLTVTAALPDTLPEAAMTVPVPATVAVRRPDELIVPIPPVTDQFGAIDTALL
jgi:hypothetical protein